MDEQVDQHALQLAFGSAGGSTSATLNTLTANLEAGLRLWKDNAPPSPLRFGAGWRCGAARNWRAPSAAPDDPGRLAFSEFNRLMFGDHPIGWEMGPGDLEPEDLSRENLLAAHGRILCRDNLTLGSVGQPRCGRRSSTTCAGSFQDGPPARGRCPNRRYPDILDEPGIYLIPRELEQTTIVMAHRSSIRQEDSRDYFASRIANSILGSGGFSSRIPQPGCAPNSALAYSAGSFWTTPDDNDGIVGALTRTKGESTIAATRAILEVMEEMRNAPPARDEVEAAVEAGRQRLLIQLPGGRCRSYPGACCTRPGSCRKTGWSGMWRGVQRVFSRRRAQRAAEAPGAGADGHPHSRGPGPVRAARRDAGGGDGVGSGGNLRPGSAGRTRRPGDAGAPPARRPPGLPSRPTWIAAIPKVSSCQRTVRNPAFRNSRPSACGPGNSPTEAGR